MHYVRCLKVHNSQNIFWEYRNQENDMGENWKYFCHVFKWKNGREAWDLKEKLEMPDLTF